MVTTISEMLSVLLFCVRAYGVTRHTAPPVAARRGALTKLSGKKVRAKILVNFHWYVELYFLSFLVLRKVL